MIPVPDLNASELAKAPRLSIVSLSEADASAEYSLAQLWRPELDEVQWKSFLADWLSPGAGRGILSARSQRGGVLGFVPWWRLPDLEHGERLWAGPFVVRELGVRPLVRDRLTEGLRDLANEWGLGLRLAEPST